MISSCPNYLHADVSDGEDLSHHQHEVTGGKLVTMSLVPGTVDSNVALECHLCCPHPLPTEEDSGPPWTAPEALCLETELKKEKRKVLLAFPCLYPLIRGTESGRCSTGTFVYSVCIVFMCTYGWWYCLGENFRLIAIWIALGDTSRNYACIYMSFVIKWHINTYMFFIRHINTTFFFKWHINTTIKLSDIHMFYKWQYMSFNIKKTYINIAYCIYMSHNF